MSHVVSKLACSLLFVMSGAFAAFAQSAAPPEVVKEIAPTGKLRAATNLGNAVLAQKGAAGAGRRDRVLVALCADRGRLHGAEGFSPQGDRGGRPAGHQDRSWPQLRL